MSRPSGPLDAAAVWTPADLEARPEWNHHLGEDEKNELLGLLDAMTVAGGTTFYRGADLESIAADDLPLPTLTPRLLDIQRQLEEGSGAIRVHGFPCPGLDEDQARLLYWAFSVHLGTPVSQSPQGERIFSVRDSGFGADDPRSRGPNTRKRLSFHTDRADVVGFLCLQQAREGGENEVASAMAVYNRILAERPDLLDVLMQPFHYLRHSVDHGNEKPWCRQPVFSFRDGHFACCFLRVLIERAARDERLPDLTSAQVEALDLVEEVAGEPEMFLRFRQQPGDLLYLNNWAVLHRRKAFVDHESMDRRRHILRLWLSMPNSRPLDPLFEDNYGAVEAGAIRGGMRARP